MSLQESCVWSLQRQVKEGKRAPKEKKGRREEVGTVFARTLGQIETTMGAESRPRGWSTARSKDGARAGQAGQVTRECP